MPVKHSFELTHAHRSIKKIFAKELQLELISILGYVTSIKR